MPFKANADRRHRIPRPRFSVTNWHDYDASLRGRGSLMVWFIDEAVASWKAEPWTIPAGSRLFQHGHPDRPDPAGSISVRPTPDRGADRLRHGPTRARPRRPRPQHAKPAHRDRGSAATTRLPRRRPSPLAGRQHRAEAVRGRRLPARESWHEGAPVVAQAASRRGRRHGADRRLAADHQRWGRRFAGRVQRPAPGQVERTHAVGAAL